MPRLAIVTADRTFTIETKDPIREQQALVQNASTIAAGFVSDPSLPTGWSAKGIADLALEIAIEIRLAVRAGE